MTSFVVSRRSATKFERQQPATKSGAISNGGRLLLAESSLGAPADDRPLHTGRPRCDIGFRH